jgi:hypothetical protein
MTGAQESYVHTLARQAGEQVAEDMTKAEASEKIDELRHKTGRAQAKPRAKRVPKGRDARRRERTRNRKRQALARSRRRPR